MSPKPRLDLKIEEMDLSGDGLARSPAGEVRVAGAVVGERVRVRVVSRPGRDPARAVVEERIQPRRRPTAPCDRQEACGCCPWMPLPASVQLQWKVRALQRELDRVCGEGRVPVGAAHAAPESLGYRNRGILPVDRWRGRVRLGYYRPRSHEVVDIDACPVLHPTLSSLIPILKRALRESRVPIYDERTGQGAIRRIGLRAGVRTGDVLVTVVSATDRGIEGFVERLQDRLPPAVGLVVNLHPDRDNRVYGLVDHAVRGPGWVRERVLGIDVRLRPRAFFQLNTDMAEVLYRWVVAAAEPAERDCADLFGGVGALGIALRRAGARSVTIVESAPSAVAEARRLAAGDHRVRVIEGRVEDCLAAVGECDLWVTDPPARGLGSSLLRAIAAHPPRRLIHLACSGAALARDLRQLLQGPFRLARPIEVFDFLPQTHHIEAAAVLDRASAP